MSMSVLVSSGHVVGAAFGAALLFFGTVVRKRRRAVHRTRLKVSREMTYIPGDAYMREICRSIRKIDDAQPNQ